MCRENAQRRTEIGINKRLINADSVVQNQNECTNHSECTICRNQMCYPCITEVEIKTLKDICFCNFLMIV